MRGGRWFWRAQAVGPVRRWRGLCNPGVHACRSSSSQKQHEAVDIAYSSLPLDSASLTVGWFRCVGSGMP